LALASGSLGQLGGEDVAEGVFLEELAVWFAVCFQHACEGVAHLLGSDRVDYFLEGTGGTVGTSGLKDRDFVPEAIGS